MSKKKKKKIGSSSKKSNRREGDVQLIVCPLCGCSAAAVNNGEDLTRATFLEKHLSTTCAARFKGVTHGEYVDYTTEETRIRDEAERIANGLLPRLPNFKDKVNHPAHYNNGKIECIEYLEDQFMDRPHEWNAVKYITRANAKGKEVEDLEKAIWYLRRKIGLIKKTGLRPNEMPQERE